MNDLTTSPLPALSLFHASRYELAERQAERLSKSDLVPKAFQGKAENCLIALELADRMNASAFMVMQNVDIIHGKPGFRALFLIGCFNACGRFEPIGYEHDDQEGGRCRAVSKVRATGDKVEGPWVSMNMAKAEGWVSKAGSKWQTMPDLMLRYRAAAFMVRTTAPEISLGLPTSDEIIDTGGEAGREVRDVTPNNPFARASSEKTVGPVTVTVEAPATFSQPVEVRVEGTVQDRLKAQLETSGITVKEALFTLQYLGVGDGKTPFSKMHDSVLEKVLRDWNTLADMVAEDRVKKAQAEGGEA
jgi:hypothetical protein